MATKTGRIAVTSNLRRKILKRILTMLDDKPRRHSLAEYREIIPQIGLNAPEGERTDWNLAFPFRETFVTAFEEVFKDVNHIGFRSRHGKKLTYTFLKKPTTEQIEKIKIWLKNIENAVAIRDCLDISFALEYRTEGGDPDSPRSKIGKLVRKAKPYNNKPGQENVKAAKRLAELIVEFIRNVECYKCTDAVLAVPSSNPSKHFHLAGYLAKRVSEAFGWEDITDALNTRKRRQLKNIGREEKPREILDSVEYDPARLKNRYITIIDDLYQSGISMNVIGLLAKYSGARRVYGLACVKTLRGDDNISETDNDEEDFPW